MTLPSWRKLLLGATLGVVAATSMAADLNLRVTVTNGSVRISPPIGPATPGTLHLPTLACDSPKGSKTCDFKVPAGSTGMVIANLSTPDQAVRWGEACAQTLKDFCGLTVKADTQVTALIGATRNVAVETTPGGRVSAGDLACVGKCTLKSLEGAPVQFVATPDIGFVFGGWIEPPSCRAPAEGTAPNTCVLTVGGKDAPRVQARFNRTNARPTLSLSVKSGTVTVTDSLTAKTALAECKAATGQTNTCRVQVPAQTPLYLKLATPVYSPGRPSEGRLVSWSGACSGGADTCNLIADGDKAVSVQVEPALEVVVSTRGTMDKGSVSTSLGGTCPDQCTHLLPLGASITVTAQPALKRRFVSWGPASPCRDEKSAICTLKATQAASYLVVPVFE